MTSGEKTKAMEKNYYLKGNWFCLQFKFDDKKKGKVEMIEKVKNVTNKLNETEHN